MTHHHHLEDTDRAVDLHKHEIAFRGAIWDVRRDTFTMDSTDTAMTREYIQHPGAVAIVAVDAQHRVAMINQYRHPVGQDCWEIPAGLRDVAGEDMVVTAQRELAEEADLVADDWAFLVDHYPSSGSSTELIRIYLAQELRTVSPEHRHTREAEEAHLTIQWVPMQHVLNAILAGEIRNSNAIAGIMSAHLVLQGTRSAGAVDAPRVGR